MNNQKSKTSQKRSVDLSNCSTLNSENSVQISSSKSVLKKRTPSNIIKSTNSASLNKTNLSDKSLEGIKRLSNKTSKKGKPH